MNIENYIINENQIIEYAIKLIEMNNSRCVLVQSDNKKIIGTISEGDVLRAILKGISIKSPLKNIINTNFKYLNDMNSLKITKIFQSGITLIPILDKKHMLINIVTLISFYSEKNK